MNSHLVNNRYAQLWLMLVHLKTAITHHPSPIAHHTSPIAHRTSHIAHRTSHIAHRYAISLLVTVCSINEACAKGITSNTIAENRKE